ncbi:hypothetical protein D3C78_1952300 [compost metagenome]
MLGLHAALTGGQTRDDLGAVLDHLGGVEGPFAARDALHQEARVVVDEDAHSLNLYPIFIAIVVSSGQRA